MCLPLDEILEMLLDEDAQLVLDPGDVLRIRRALVWDLIIFEALISLVVARRAEAF